MTSEDYIYSPDKPNPGPPYLTETNLAKDKYKKPEKLIENPDVIVIGSGIGGMGVASIFAQKKRYKVLLLEAGPVPGGSTHCYELGGFEWNSGIDSIGDMDPTVGRGLYRPTIDYLTGGKLQWAKMPDVHEICCFGDEIYNWYSSEEKNIEWVEKRFPGQGNIRKYYALEQSVEWWAWAWAVTKLLPTWIPESIRNFFYIVFGGNWRKYMLRKTKEVFRDILGFSEKLAAVYSYMYGNHGRTPAYSPFAFHAVNLFHYRYGAYYPVGGPGQIAECIIPIIEEAGGQLAVSSPVDKILVENNRAVGVRLEDGQEVRCPLIISNASAYTTFMQLLDREVGEQHGYPQKFTQIGPSPAHLYLFLGYDEAIELPQQIFWHMPTYPGIDQYDLDALDATYKEKTTFEGMGGYLFSPSARDPVFSQRYPNKSTVIVLAEAPPHFVKQYREDPNFKQRFEKEVGENLEKIVFRHMPQLKDKKPSFKRVGVPMGCNIRAWEGCSLGLEPTGERFVYHTHWLRPQTKIRGLYLTGQDAFSAGFCGAMLSSRLCYSAITGNWFFMLKKKP